MKHTPTPWTVESEVHPQIPYKDRVWITPEDHPDVLLAENLSIFDAQHIVRCVNSHDALVAALQECITDYGNACFERRDYLAHRVETISKIARAALQSAK